MILLFIIQFLSYGQDSRKYQKLYKSINYRKGYIVMSDSMKVEGLIRDGIMSETANYSSVKFAGKDGKKKKYKPSDIMGFGYSIYNFVSDGSLFYRVIISGPRVSLYKNIEVRSGSLAGSPGSPPMHSSYTNEKFYVKKTGETSFICVRKNKFIENLSEYFADCESLKVKILNKELRQKDIESIVRKYNYCSN